MAKPSEEANQTVSRPNSGFRISTATGQWFKAQSLVRPDMVSTSWLEDEVRSVLPNCSVEAIDLHGTGDHFHIRIIEDTFEGMRPLQRQKIILNHFKPHIPSPIHAIDLKCMTPQQAESSGDTAFDPHGGGQGIHIKRIRKHQNKE
ncbi:MAG TPA: BolA/IbaG family iron-sulfur metabolism protein [Candidatus Poseidoniales archaeon]|nr:MAG: hypothetical protein CXT71_02280 [Euryarchaeota archaeon]HIF45448.1 BolA/IbaG family iron-sulfur metabolism protein [Candidatus Poseidoniales archaeon]HIL65318.1 BolA/IbaG family iron-sulfur metabolism protein [Candidatus Poseidoniales archaeon]